MQACTQWTHSDVLSQLATTPECLLNIGEQQSEEKQWNGDRRAICDATRDPDAGRGVIRHRGVSDGSDGARRISRCHSARTEKSFANGGKMFKNKPNYWNLEFQAGFGKQSKKRQCMIRNLLKSGDLEWRGRLRWDVTLAIVCERYGVRSDWR